MHTPLNQTETRETLPYDAMPLRWATVRFQLRAIDAIEFANFPGFVLRSGFGFALRQLCRYRESDITCQSCDYRDTCPYSLIFETPRSENSMPDFSAENFPHPFVMTPPSLYPQIVQQGQSFTVRFTLFGRGVPYLLFYIYAFDLLGERGLGRTRGRFLLERVYDATDDRVIFSHHDKTIKNSPQIHQMQSDVHSTNRLQLRFMTPAKILKNERPLQKLDTDSLIRGLLRRASLLARLHDNAKWSLDFQKVIDQFNKGVAIIDNRTRGIKLVRHSSRQKRSHPLYAMIGAANLVGDLDAFMPLLRLGAVMHLGSSTSQGLGKYTLAQEERIQV